MDLWAESRSLPDIILLFPGEKSHSELMVLVNHLQQLTVGATIFESTSIKVITHLGDIINDTLRELKLAEQTMETLIKSSVIMHQQINELTEYAKVLRQNLNVACDTISSLEAKETAVSSINNCADITCSELLISRVLHTPLQYQSKSSPSKRESGPCRILDENGCDIVAESIDIIRSIRSSQKFEELSASVGASGRKKFDGEQPCDTLNNPLPQCDAEVSLLDDSSCDGTVYSDAYSDAMQPVISDEESGKIMNYSVIKSKTIDPSICMSPSTPDQNSLIELKAMKNELLSTKHNLTLAIDELHATQFEVKKSKEMVGNLESSIVSLKVLLRAEREKSSRLEEQLSTVKSVVKKQLSISSKQKTAAAAAAVSESSSKIH